MPRLGVQAFSAIERQSWITMDHEESMGSAFAATSVENCYQCGKCTAGCPASDEMDFMPNQILRLVQTDDVDRAMRSRAICCLEASGSRSGWAPASAGGGGVWVFKVFGRRGGEVTPFSGVRDELVARLTARKRAAALQEWLREAGGRVEIPVP